MTTPRSFLGLLHAAAPDAAQALVALLRSAGRDGVADVPRLGTLDGAVVARGLYRAWLGEHAWAPLLAIDPARLSAADRAAADELARAAPVARGGWLYVGAGWERLGDRAALVALAADAGARLLLQVEASLGPLPPLVGAAIRSLDAHHAVATDPTLARARGALLAHCARAETVYLSGPIGSGRRALARWAHAVLDDRPLCVLGGGSPPEPGAWWLVPELGELDAAALAPLRGRLEAAEAPLVAPMPRGPASRTEHKAFAGIVGRSAGLCEVLGSALHVAKHPIPVLVLGESGTGKEPLAQAIHAASERKGHFVAVDLASRSATLVDDDLFGNVRGAFDGARGREGAFKRAHGGTLFLDELGNLPLGVQAKLLRVLERGEVQPLGSDELVRVDVRVVAATNADLEAMVRLGEFRRDLLQRLAGQVLRLPPLRDRIDDLPALVRHFSITQRGGSVDVTPAALDVLRAHAWPGNIRELQKVIQVAVAASNGDAIEPEHLGDLAPARARKVPVLVTGDAAALDATALPRRQVRQLGALTLTLDGPADRGAPCVRNAALHLLSGRAVTFQALQVLEAHPWWGGFVEMQRKLAALAAMPPGIIDPERIVACLPELAEVSGWDPILAVQHPTVRDDDTVVGLQASLAAAAVVIGRARRRVDLEAPRAAWLDRVVGDGNVAFLPFPHLGTLSRLHVAVTRVGEGLLVHHSPGARLDVRAGPVGGGLGAVVEGAPVAVGAAGVVQVLGDDGPLVELYLFRGQVALRAAAPLLRGSDADPRATAHVGAAQRARAVTPDEADLLLDWMGAFVDGEEVFSTALRRVVAPSRFKELAAQLLTANPSQSFKRMLEHRANAGLRQRVGATLKATGRWERARARLPAQVWAVLAETDTEG